jgi:hypothetical protein
MFSFIWPGFATVMTPAHVHISCEVLLRVGRNASTTCGDPGVHGAVVAGMHG